MSNGGWSMQKYISQITISFFLLMLTPLLSLPPAYGAPGDFLFKWGSQDSYMRPNGVVVDGNGNIYAADSNSDRIQVFNSTGTLARVLGGFGTGNGQLSW